MYRTRLTKTLYLLLFGILLALFTAFGPSRVAEAEPMPTTEVQVSCTGGAVHVAGLISQSMEWSPTCASVYILDQQVAVADGTTLTLLPGTVVKSLAADLVVLPGGSVVAAGTPAQHVIFTSIHDDAVAGDTGGDGAASSPKAGDWAGLVQRQTEDHKGGSIRLSYAKVNYASSGVTVVTDGVSISNSQFDHEANAAVLASNFTGSASGWYKSNKASDTPVAGVLLLGETNLTKNTVINNGSSWAVVVSVPGSESHVRVRSGATLTVAGNAVVKFGDVAANIVVDPGARFTGTGTENARVTFTSAFDNSIGAPAGTRFTDSPKAGDWAGIRVLSSGLVLRGVHIRYASTAFDLPQISSATLSGMSISSSVVGLRVPLGFVSYRGSFSSTPSSVVACDWLSTCAVDAAYVTWDGERGPHRGLTSLVCGAVTVSPWYPDKSKDRTFRVQNCSGAIDPGSALTAAASDFAARTVALSEQCLSGVVAALSLIHI